MPNDANTAAEQFTKALHQLEETGDIKALQACFADDAELHALVSGRDHKGGDGVEEFWKEYLTPFETIHSDFTRVTADGKLAVLEWVGKGTLKDKNGQRRDIEYPGCSILEFADDGGKVKRFRTFYDSAAFVTVEA